jgi:hypothetical protein
MPPLDKGFYRIVLPDSLLMIMMTSMCGQRLFLTNLVGSSTCCRRRLKGAPMDRLESMKNTKVNVVKA